MKHHSPNFLNNLEEVEKAPYVNLWTGIKWTAILFATLFALFSMTSCTKEVSKPFPVSVPNNRPVPVTVTIKFYNAYHPYVVGPVYGLEIRTDKVMSVKTTFRLQWKDGKDLITLEPFIFEGYNAMRWETMIPIIKGATDLQLLNVEGNKNVFYTLKLMP